MRKIAVHLHLYYREQLDDLLQRLQNFGTYSYDLFVTMVAKNYEVVQKIKAFNNNAKIWIVPNLGYDIGPFIDFLHKIDLDAYDYIVKIHTKRTLDDKYAIFNGHRIDMKTWRNMLLDSVISRQAVSGNMQILNQNQKIGMIGSCYVLTDEVWAYREVSKKISEEVKKIGFEVPEDKHFIAGTMFWVRAKLLKPFLFYSISDFALTDKNIHDATLAHVLERMFGLLITAQGYSIKGLYYKSFRFMFLVASFKRFLFQKKITRRGFNIVKICKIPVYYRKEKQI